MVIDFVSQISQLEEKSTAPAFAPGSRVLMVTPEHFRIDYAINPYMKDESGNLRQVDTDAAAAQWHTLKAIYESIGFPVDTIDGDVEFPDMVFAANQSFPFLSDGEKVAILSKMRSEKRRGEVAHFEQFYRRNGYRTFELQTPGAFEGNGDAIAHVGRPWIWGGYGTRTDKAVYHELSERFGFSVIRLALENEKFYHLDTCFAVLRSDTVAIQSSAFNDEGRQLIHALFDDVIEIDYDEALNAFAGNCFCPNGTDVLMHPGARRFRRDLERRGFVVHEVDTSEFIKSGGSVFCLKMLLP